MQIFLHFRANFLIYLIVFFLIFFFTFDHEVDLLTLIMTLDYQNNNMNSFSSQNTSKWSFTLIPIIVFVENSIFDTFSLEIDLLTLTLILPMTLDYQKNNINVFFPIKNTSKWGITLVALIVPMGSLILTLKLTIWPCRWHWNIKKNLEKKSGMDSWIKITSRTGITLVPSFIFRKIIFSEIIQWPSLWRSLKVTRGRCQGGSVPDCDPLSSNIYHAKFHVFFHKMHNWSAIMGLTALLL